MSKSKQQGAQGERGIPGPPGPAGRVGQRGPVGAKGKSGARGATGATGASGAVGAKGATTTRHNHVNALAVVHDQIDHIHRELDVQMKRMAQLQAEVDGVRGTLKRLMADSN